MPEFVKLIFTLAAKPRFCNIIRVAREAQLPDSNSTASFDEAWTEVRGDEDIQFTAAKMPESPETPQWWRDFLEWLGDVFGPVAEALAYSWPVLKYVLLAIFIAGVLALIWVILSPYIDDWRGRVRKPVVDDEWRPEEGVARKWLDEADALAAKGQYEEAAHLLLFRSIEDIERRRPELLRPSNTTREIERFDSLPDKARNMFSVIASHVERGVFAAAPIGKEGWSAARNAYGEFALADSWTAVAKR